MFNKILIANRGEIACRIMQTCKRLDINSVAVYSDADSHARHVQMADEAWHIGGSRPSESYLCSEKIIAIAKASNAEAIHPGYGFLSENADFARAVEAAGLVFIGPTPDAIAAMGSKSAAKALMDAAHVPIVPGYHGDNQNDDFLAEQAKQIGFPLLIKAVSGGGGKGMRLVNHIDEFSAQLNAARREAKNAFGDDAMLLELFVTGPHHIEFQVFGDTHGNFVHLYERECSIQRRHQKILEETPSPFLDDAMRVRMGEAAVAAAAAINYRGAGTIEFIVGENREFFFMEMNTRLQVEHPITEMITGQDLVEWQLRIAAGEPIPLSQNIIPRQGHAIEVRICAENPENNFLPETGTLSRFVKPTGDHVRVDTGVDEGDSIRIFYDSMIAKLIVYGENRLAAIRRLRRAFTETAAIGLKTNIRFLQQLIHHPAFENGDTDTQFIERHRNDLFANSPIPDMAIIAAACFRLDDENQARVLSTNSLWRSNEGWRLNGESLRQLFFFDPLTDKRISIAVGNKKGHCKLMFDGREFIVSYHREKDRIALMHADKRFTMTVLRYHDHFTVLTQTTRYDLLAVDPFDIEMIDEVPEGRLTALMPGRIVKQLVARGDKVNRGQPLLIIEAMKMEHTIHSPRDGSIEKIIYQVDDIVEADALLFTFTADGE